MTFSRFRRKTKGPGGHFRLAAQPGRFTREQRLTALVLAAAFLVLVAAVTKRWSPESEQDFAIDTEGYATKTYTAPFNFTSIDLDATRRRQAEAVAAVPETYLVDRKLVEQRLAEFNEHVEAIKSLQDEVGAAVRQALLASTSAQTASEVVESAVAEVARQAAGQPPLEFISSPERLAPWLMPDPATVPARVLEESARAEAAEPAEAAALDDGPDAQEEGPAAQALQTVALEEKTPKIRLAQADRLAELGRNALQHVLYQGIFSPEVLQASSAQAVVRGPEEAVVQGAAIPVEKANLRDVEVERSILMGDLPKFTRHPRPEAPDPSDGAQMLRRRIQSALMQATGLLGEPSDNRADLQQAVFAVAAASLGPTVVYDEVTTGDREAQARNLVEEDPVEKTIQKGQPLQEAAKPWTEQSVLDVKTMLERMGGQEHQRSVLLGLLANMILVGLILWCLVKVLYIFTQDNRREQLKYLALNLLVICTTVLAGRVAMYFEDSGYLVPVTCSALLLAILQNTRVAATATLLMALLVSIQYGYDWQLLIVLGSMALAGVFTIHEVRKRGDLARAALTATAVGLATAAAVTLAGDSFMAVGWNRLLMVLINGMLSWLMVSGFLSPLEKLFDITTDIQLLEYSDLNNEVLSRMAVETPATYAHSLMLGQLAEAACNAIGANGLLARVCAYYHDIGKLRRPEYFTENQTGANVHDALSPRMSARAIASHVTVGAEMAREFHLPKPIIDAIYEHHGTCKISFFYDQAVKQQKHGGLREEDFRYPGPKPQSPETAVLMICDAVESAVRSLKNPNEERVRELVTKIIRGRADDRQFDECDLTLKDLDEIGDVIAKRVLTTHHRRIEYPDQTPKNDEGAPQEDAEEAVHGPVKA
jgi:hypothetical protein